MRYNLTTKQKNLARLIVIAVRAGVISESFKVILHESRGISLYSFPWPKEFSQIIDPGEIDRGMFQALIDAQLITFTDDMEFDEGGDPIRIGAITIKGWLYDAVDAGFADESLPERRQNALPLRATHLKDTAFIMMWMDPAHPELEDVANAIKDVCKEFKIDAKRADDIEHSDKITDLVLQRIAESEFLIADLTGSRPNVYYEVGYTHALGKRPVLHRKKGAPLHFDLSVHNVPEYRNVSELKTMLRKRLEAMLGRAPSVQPKDP